MPIGLLLVSALVACAWALWIRRAAWGCRWEGAPTLAIVMAAAATYLTSPHASNHLGPKLHRLTTLWNLEDFLGNLCGITAACTMVYMCMVRFGDDHTTEREFAKWVTYPMTLVVPVMFILFVTGVGSKGPNEYFEDIEPGPRLALYWLTFTVTLIYLMGNALRILFILREVDGRSAVIDIYLATVMLSICTVLTLFFHVVTPFNLRDAAWTMAYLAVTGWAGAPGLSWWIRSRPLVIVHPSELAAEDRKPPR